MIRYIGKIPAENIEDDDIRWIVIEPHTHYNSIVGYFMYLHESIGEPAKWDNWYQTLDIAFEAGEAYGLKKEDWNVQTLN